MTKKQPRPLTWRAAQVGQADVGPGGCVVEWPRPVREGEWIDAEGFSWRMRGSRLTASQARRLMSRPEVTVVWAYELEVTSVNGPERAELLARVGTFFEGEGPPHSHFDLGEFRDQGRQVMLMIEESC